MIKVDYPDQWPTLLSDTIARLKSTNNKKSLFAILTVIKISMTSYQMLVGEKRLPLQLIMNKIFPYLENLAGNQIKDWQDDLSPRLMLLILECFYNCSYIQIESYFKEQELKTWMLILKSILDMKIPTEIGNQIKDWDEILERAEHPVWKMKTLSVEIICKWNYHSFVNKKKTELEQAIRKAYLSSYSLGFLESCFQYIKGYRLNYVAPRLVQYALRSIYYALQVDEIFEKFKPNLERILLDNCLPLLAINQKDEFYWQEEPKQFIYSEYAVIEDHNTVKNASKFLMSLIVQCWNEKDEALIVKFLDFFGLCFKNEENPRTKEKLNPLMKEYLMHGFESFYDAVEGKEETSEKVQFILENFISKELESEHAILRARASSVFIKYAVMGYKSPQTYAIICKGICSNLVHKKLPVRVKAAIAISKLLIHEEIKNLLINDLKTILQNLIELMNKIELEDLVEALKITTGEFRHHIGPFAVDIIKKLAENFYNYKQAVFEKTPGSWKNVSVSDEYNETNLAADACLEAITNILKSDLDVKVYKQVGPIILEILNISILSLSLESTENSLSFLNLVLYKSNNVSDHLVFYYPILVYLIAGMPKRPVKLDVSKMPKNYQKILSKKEIYGDQMINFESTIGCFLNFMAKMGDRFLTSTDIFGISFIELLFEMMRKIGSGCLISNTDVDIVLCMRLLIGLIENFRGKIDKLIPKILDVSQDLMKEKRSESLKSILLQVVCMMFWYNGDLTMKLLFERKVLKNMLEAWFSNINVFNTTFEKERELLGLAGLLGVSKGNFPDVRKMKINF